MRARRRSRTMALAAAAMVVATGVAACSSSSSGGSSSASGGASSTAKSITVWTAQNVLYDFQKSTLADFTKQTGIKVTFDQYPESSYTDKLNIAQTSHDKSFDLYMAPQALIAQYVSLGSAEPYDSYLSNTTLTPADYNIAEGPKNLMASCQYQGKTYCVPIFASAPMLFYNKKIFAQAGISSPPQTQADIVTDAAKIKATGTPGYCSRASADTIAYTSLMFLPNYLPYTPQDKGFGLDANYKPQWNSPDGIKLVTDMQTLLKDDGPKGIASFTQVECEALMQNGKLGMWMDTSALAPSVYDPTQSKAAADIGFDMLPCPPSNPDACKFPDSWGFFVNKNASQDNKNAAYKLMTWLSSKKVQEEALAANQPSLAWRTSVLSENVAGSKVPADVVKGQNYGFSHLDPNLIPTIPQFNQILQQVATQLSKVVSGQATPTAAMNAANSQVTNTLKQAGLLK
jgi:ABC-type glycerol-3-phosphate transport system substrate-binding protein